MPSTEEVRMFLTQSIVPVMEKNRFSELVGIEIGVVNGWIDKGYLGTIKIGKHRLVNLLALSHACLEESE